MSKSERLSTGAGMLFTEAKLGGAFVIEPEKRTDVF